MVSLPSGIAVLILHPPEGGLGLRAAGFGDRCRQVTLWDSSSPLHTHLVPHSSGIGKNQPCLIPLCWGDEEGPVSERPWGAGEPAGAFVPCQSPGTLPPPLLTLSVLCPQASAAGKGPSGTGIVCGAPAPSSPLNRLSPFFFSHASLLFLPSCWFLFAVFSSAGSCFGLTQAVCFAEQGAPQLVSAPPPISPSGSLPGRSPSLCCLQGAVSWSGGAVLPETHSTLARWSETRLGVPRGFLCPNS